jgi:hypothetical protein
MSNNLYLEMGSRNIGRKRRKPIDVSKKEHTPNGFPHYSTITKHGHCMCLDECCQSWENGCICKYCPCKRGIPHEHRT